MAKELSPLDYNVQRLLIIQRDLDRKNYDAFSKEELERYEKEVIEYIKSKVDSSKNVHSVYLFDVHYENNPFKITSIKKR